MQVRLWYSPQVSEDLALEVINIVVALHGARLGFREVYEIVVSDASKSTDGIVSASLLGFQRPQNAAPAFWVVSITIDGGPEGDEFVFHDTIHDDVKFVPADYMDVGQVDI